MKVWMTTAEHGGPLSLDLPTGRLDAQGQPSVYKFVRGQATEVADEDVDRIVGLTHVDKHGTPRSYLTRTAPTVELNENEQLRAAVAHQGDLIQHILAENPELAKKLGVTSVDDSSPIAGL